MTAIVTVAMPAQSHDPRAVIVVIVAASRADMPRVRGRPQHNRPKRTAPVMAAIVAVMMTVQSHDPRAVIVVIVAAS